MSHTQDTFNGEIRLHPPIERLLKLNLDPFILVEQARGIVEILAANSDGDSVYTSPFSHLFLATCGAQTLLEIALENAPYDPAGYSNDFILRVRQAKGILQVLGNSSQGFDFNAPIHDVFHSFCGVGELLDLAMAERRGN